MQWALVSAVQSGGACLGAEQCPHAIHVAGVEEEERKDKEKGKERQRHGAQADSPIGDSHVQRRVCLDAHSVVYVSASVSQGQHTLRRADTGSRCQSGPLRAKV